MSNPHESNRRLLPLTLGALGIVFGDISTSPLYALRECFNPASGLEVDATNIFGVLSLIFWALTVIISLKYLLYVMKADNGGEGGVLALMSLAAPERRTAPTDRTGHRKGQTRTRAALVFLGLFGASLLYGDGIITPAISVLSAIEGLRVIAPSLDKFVIPITVLILFLLFLPQKMGTAKIGACFGPIIFVWLSWLGILGVFSIWQTPEILYAVNPLLGVQFLSGHLATGGVVLGAVFLTVTGGEALYADMGHFGKEPIRLGWFTLVFPALILNYFGQGALLLRDPASMVSPFFHMVPELALIPTIVLATLATVIASQAVISGAFSLTRQAISLGYLPRMAIRHTSAQEVGQIYVGRVNWALLIGSVWLVLEFKSSEALAGAYGVAVSTTMVITTLLLFVVSRRKWKWSLWICLPLTLALTILDSGFMVANLAKIPEGGWFPLVIAALSFTAMTTWRRGRMILSSRLRERAIPISEFLQSLKENPPVVIDGTSVFMIGSLHGMPPSLLHNVRHNKVIHQTVILLSVKIEDVPYVSRDSYIDTTTLSDGVYQVVASYGFFEKPDVPAILRDCANKGLKMNLDDLSFYLGRETLIPSAKPGMAIWRERLFAFMSVTAQRATVFFNIPPESVMEIGVQVEL